MKVNRENRNCYNCRDFGYLVRNCRNRWMRGRIEEKIRLEYRENKNNRKRRRIERESRQNNNLNGE